MVKNINKINDIKEYRLGLINKTRKRPNNISAMTIKGANTIKYPSPYCRIRPLKAAVLKTLPIPEIIKKTPTTMA